MTEIALNFHINFNGVKTYKSVLITLSKPLIFISYLSRILLYKYTNFKKFHIEYLLGLQVGARLEQNCTSPINVTTNPLEHFSGRKQPVNQHQQTQQATIVVQQPSVSVDNHSVSTVLLKNGEFLSTVQLQDKIKQLKQKEENVKQLLDVANNLTLEEIHDFEMR